MPDVQILKRENTCVMAGARTPDTADALQQLKKGSQDRLHIVSLDLSDTASIYVSSHRGHFSLNVALVKSKHILWDMMQHSPSA